MPIQRPTEQPSPSPGLDGAPPVARRRVAMLVRNTGQYDTRVRKEATALVVRGYEVRVFAIAAAGVPERDTVGLAEYERVQHAPWTMLLGRDACLRRRARAKELYLARRGRLVGWRRAAIARHAAVMTVARDFERKLAAPHEVQPSRPGVQERQHRVTAIPERVAAIQGLGPTARRACCCRHAQVRASRRVGSLQVGARSSGTPAPTVRFAGRRWGSASCAWNGCRR
jgi:hypothetical protein